MPSRSKSPARPKGGARSKSPGRTGRERNEPVRKRRKGGRDDGEDEDEDEDEVLPKELTRKIIAQAREQQAEVEEEERAARGGRRGGGLSVAAALAEQDGGAASSDEEDEEEIRGRSLGENEYYEDVEELELDEHDERALSLFMGGGAPRNRNLSDIIMEKLAAAEAASGARAAAAAAGEPSAAPMPELPPKVIEVYQGVGLLLKSYRSGKLPKAFKIVPRLANWEEILFVTEPHNWSRVATREATKLFASNMNARMAQRFFNLVLLPAVQDDILENGKLNFHLYLALKKALYKPAAFFKGVLLPLAEEGSSTLKVTARKVAGRQTSGTDTLTDNTTTHTPTQQRAACLVAVEATVERSGVTNPGQRRLRCLCSFCFQKTVKHRGAQCLLILTRSTSPP